MAWQFALWLSIAAGIAHVLSLRTLFLLVGLAQLTGGVRMHAEQRRGVRGWGSRVAFVAACIGSAYHLVMLVLASIEILEGAVQEPGFLLQTVLWSVLDPLIIFALAWGSPDGQTRVRLQKQPGLV